MENERDIIAETVREELAKLAATTGGAKDAPAATAEPWKINILGKEYSYATREEGEAALSATFQKAGAELEALRNAAPVAKEKEGAYVSGKEGEEIIFSQDKYIELMGKGPKGILEATNYALNHTIFGGKENDAAGTLRQALEESQRQKATLAVYQFRELHPEFPLTPEATTAIDNIRKELGQSFSLQGLEAAYGVAQARGLVPSPQVAAYHRSLVEKGLLQEPPKQQVAANNPFSGGNSWQAPPPPSVSRQAGVQAGEDIASLADKMSYEQLEKYARDKGWV